MSALLPRSDIDVGRKQIRYGPLGDMWAPIVFADAGRVQGRREYRMRILLKCRGTRS